ncbi:MAG: SH3 domain-containing protein [Clostridia bacterium]|nr:SH3 domain-containing protein [Clostridia bacterium]
MGAAEILPVQGTGQIGGSAVVLCESLTVRSERSASALAVTTLHYGDRLVVRNSYADGWADCFLSETEGRTGFVKSDYLAIDPVYFRADGPTAVYAWQDETAPQGSAAQSRRYSAHPERGGGLAGGRLRIAAGCVKKMVCEQAGK